MEHYITGQFWSKATNNLDHSRGFEALRREKMPRGGIIIYLNTAYMIKLILGNIINHCGMDFTLHWAHESMKIVQMLVPQSLINGQRATKASQERSHSYTCWADILSSCLLLGFALHSYRPYSLWL